MQIQPINLYKKMLFHKKITLGIVVFSLFLAYFMIEPAKSVGQDSDPTKMQAPNGKVRALLIPRTESILSSQIAGKITAINVSEGDRFKKDDALIQFDCSVLNAELQKAKADLFAAQETKKTNDRLLKLDSISQLEVKVSDAHYSKAASEVERITSMSNYCTIRAPFDGRLVKRLVKPFETVSEGEALLEILDDSVLEIEMYVPSYWLSWLKVGTEFTLDVDETKKTYPAKVKSLGAKVDPVSQSLKITGEISGDFTELMSGMGGQSLFNVPKD